MDVRPMRTRRRQKAHHVADQNRFLELDAVHGHGQHQRQRSTGTDHFAACADRAGLIDVTEDDAAEDRAIDRITADPGRTVGRGFASLGIMMTCRARYGSLISLF